MNSKTIQNQESKKDLLGRRALTQGCSPFQSFPCVCLLCWHVCMCVPVFPCSWLFVWTLVLVHICACACALGILGGKYSKVWDLLETHLSPQRWTLPVSSFPPWHFLCPHIRISEAPAMEHEPFLIFLSHDCAEGNICVHKSFFI